MLSVSCKYDLIFSALSVPAAVNYMHIVALIQYGSIPSNADSIALIFIITHASGTPQAGTGAYIDDVSVSTGINNLQEDNSFQITPNPADQFISIEFSSAINRQSVVFITDITGRLVYSHTIPDEEKNQYGNNDS